MQAFLPPYDAGSLAFRASQPVSQAVAVLGGAAYSYFRYEMHLAAQNAPEVFREASGEFAALTGRHYDLAETYRLDGAEIVFVMLGSFATKARDAVDELRSAGTPVGLLRPRLFRPFPANDVRRWLAGKRAVVVVDQNLAIGAGGVLHAELGAALYGQRDAPAHLLSFVGGLGGRDITVEEFYEMARAAREAIARGVTPPPRLLYREDELREVRKLQAIARVERDELRRDA